MKKIEMPTGESKDFLEVIAVLGNDLPFQAFVSLSGYFLVDNFISHLRKLLIESSLSKYCNTLGEKNKRLIYPMGYSFL